jgi:Na+/melibiose symporter-like transporter
VIGRLARRYGASPWHLAGHLAYLAFAGYVLAPLLDRPSATNIVVWLVAAVLLHDLVLLPLYSLLDRARGRAAPRPLAAALRTAAVLSGVTLLVFFPPILGLGNGTFARAAGYAPSGYLARWLALSGAVTLASLAAAAFRTRRRAARRSPRRTASRRAGAPPGRGTAAPGPRR